jgi:hypothetical protein
MKQKPRANGVAARSQSRQSNINARIKHMIASGMVEDEVSTILKIEKNRLREQHILALKAGRKIWLERKAAAAPAATARDRKQQDLRDAIEASFLTHWYHPKLGNVLYGGARTLEEALAWPKKR